MKEFISFILTILVLTLFIGVIDVLAMPMDVEPLDKVMITVENNDEYLYHYLKRLDMGDEKIIDAFIDNPTYFLSGNPPDYLTKEIERAWISYRLLDRSTLPIK